MARGATQIAANRPRSAGRGGLAGGATAWGGVVAGAGIVWAPAEGAAAPNTRAIAGQNRSGTPWRITPETIQHLRECGKAFGRKPHPVWPGCQQCPGADCVAAFVDGFVQHCPVVDAELAPEVLAARPQESPSDGQGLD